MVLAARLIELPEPDPRRPATIAVAQNAHREIGRLDRIVEALAEIGMGGRRAIGGVAHG